MADRQKVVYGILNGTIFNDLEQPLINPVFNVSLFFDSEYLINGKDTAVVTMEGEQETAHQLFSGTSLNDLE